MTRNILHAASLLLAIAIAGCGGADAPNESTAPQGAAKPQASAGVLLGKAPTAPRSLDGLPRSHGPLASPTAQADAG